MIAEHNVRILSQYEPDAVTVVAYAVPMGGWIGWYIDKKILRAVSYKFYPIGRRE